MAYFICYFHFIHSNIDLKSTQYSTYIIKIEILHLEIVEYNIRNPLPTAYMDSNSEDSDSDVSDVEGIDSDLEAESKQSYDRSGIG